MSKVVGNKLPADLYQRLAGNNLQSHAEKAIVICTVDVNGWPHPAMLSYFEVIAKDDRNIRLAVYGDTTTTNNMRRNGKLSMVIVDERVAYYIKGTVEELAGKMTCSPQNAKFNCRVEQVLADEANEEYEPGSYITCGILYKRRADPREQKKVLRELVE
jgi:hypothetical protein